MWFTTGSASGSARATPSPDPSSAPYHIHLRGRSEDVSSMSTGSSNYGGTKKRVKDDKMDKKKNLEQLQKAMFIFPEEDDTYEDEGESTIKGLIFGSSKKDKEKAEKEKEKRQMKEREKEFGRESGRGKDADTSAWIGEDENSGLMKGLSLLTRKVSASQSHPHSLSPPPSRGGFTSPTQALPMMREINPSPVTYSTPLRSAPPSTAHLPLTASIPTNESSTYTALPSRGRRSGHSPASASASVARPSHYIKASQAQAIISPSVYSDGSKSALPLYGKPRAASSKYHLYLSDSI